MRLGHCFWALGPLSYKTFCATPLFCVATWLANSSNHKQVARLMKFRLQNGPRRNSSYSLFKKEEKKIFDSQNADLDMMTNHPKHLHLVARIVLTMISNMHTRAKMAWSLCGTNNSHLTFETYSFCNSSPIPQ